MLHIRAICFDLFNTLVNVGRVPEAVGRFTADILGIDHDVWNEACFGPHHEICRATDAIEVIRALAHSIDAGIPHETIRQATVERQQRFDYALHNVERDIMHELHRLRQAGYRLALISNASTGEVLAWPRSKLASLFDFVVFSCECGLQKPDVSISQYAASGLALNANECVFVGDGGSQEFRGASNAGMYTVLSSYFLRPQRYQRIMQEQGDCISAEIDHIRDLQARLAIM